MKGHATDGMVVRETDLRTRIGMIKLTMLLSWVVTVRTLTSVMCVVR